MFSCLHVDEDDVVIPPSCTSVHVKALRQGYAIITAKYRYKDINLKASVTVAAYIPLKVLPIHPCYLYIFLLAILVLFTLSFYPSKHLPSFLSLSIPIFFQF